MLENLGQWYLEAGLGTEETMLRFRKVGIESWTDQSNLSQAVETVRLYRGRGAVSSDLRTAFMSVFVSADSSFRTKNNDNEVRVLAAAAIESILKASDIDRADATALALAASRFGTTTGTGMVAEVETVSDKYLGERATAVREFGSLGFAKLKAKTKRTLEDLSKPPLADLAALVNALTPALADVADVLSSAVEAVEHVDQLHRESSDVLWWLFGGRCDLLKTEFSRIDQECAPVILAIELATRTRLIPGFRAFEAFLAAALQKVGGSREADRTLATAIRSLTAPALHAATNGLTLPPVDIAPALRCLQLRRTYGEQSVWESTAGSELGSVFKHQCSALDLATQVYLELMLVRALSVEGNE